MSPKRWSLSSLNVILNTSENKMLPQLQIQCRRINLHITASKALQELMSGKWFYLDSFSSSRRLSQTVFPKHQCGWANWTAGALAAPFSHSAAGQVTACLDHSSCLWHMQGEHQAWLHATLHIFYQRSRRLHGSKPLYRYETGFEAQFLWHGAHKSHPVAKGHPLQSAESRSGAGISAL